MFEKIKSVISQSGNFLVDFYAKTIQKWLSKACNVLLSCIASLPLALRVRRQRFIARLRFSYTMVCVDQRKKQLADVCCYTLAIWWVIPYDVSFSFSQLVLIFSFPFNQVLNILTVPALP